MEYILTELDFAANNKRQRQSSNSPILAIPMLQFLQAFHTKNEHILSIYHAIVEWETKNQNCYQIAPSCGFLVTRVYSAFIAASLDISTVFSFLRQSRVRGVELLSKHIQDEDHLRSVLYSITLWKRFEVRYVSFDLESMMHLVFSRAPQQHSSRHLAELNHNEIIRLQRSCFERPQQRNNLPKKYDQPLPLLPLQQQPKQFLQFLQPLEITLQKTNTKICQVVISHWKLVVSHQQHVRKTAILTWYQKLKIKKIVLYLWQMFTKRNQQLGRMVLYRWKRFVIYQKKLRKKRHKKQLQTAKKQILRQREQQLFLLAARLQKTQKKFFMLSCIRRWKQFASTQRHQRLVVQLVQQQWFQKTVNPARLADIQMERVLIQFLTKAITACIIHFYVLLNLLPYTKGANEFIRLLEDITRREPTLSFALKSCQKLLASSFIKLTLKFLDKKPCLQKYKSASGFFTDLISAVERFSFNLKRLSLFIPEEQQAITFKQVLSPRYDIPVFHILRWQRNNHAPKYIVFFPEEEAVQAVLAWLSESRKKPRSVSVIELLHSFLGKYMQGPNGEFAELFVPNLKFFASKPVQIKFVTKPRS